MLVNVVCICKSRGVDQATCLGAIAFRGFTVVVVTTKFRFGCLALPDFCSSPMIFASHSVEGDLWHFIGQLSAWLSSEPFLVHRARFYAPSLDSLEKACRVWFILRVFDAKCSTNWSFSSLPWVRWDRDCQCSSNKKWCLKCSKRKKKRHWATQVLLAGAWWAIKAVYMSSWQLSVWWVHYSTRFENASLSMSFSSFTISRLFSIIVECGM